ncbi:MAG: hypothetical protein AAF514_04185, partial [Verrucomicrobiota bacterium]
FFNDVGDWPAGADGDGGYLVVAAPEPGLDLGAPSNWRLSGAEDEPAAGSGPVEPGEGFAAWVASAVADEELRGLGDDPDVDGLANLMEYALGTDPADGSGNEGLSISREESENLYRYPRNTTATDVNLWVEFSSTGLAWAEMDRLELMASEPLEGNREWKRFRDSEPGRTGLVRLRAALK